MKRTAGKSLRTRKAMEQAIHLIFLLCGIVAVGFVLCISVYLVISGLPAIREIGLTKFLLSLRRSRPAGGRGRLLRDGG